MAKEVEAKPLIYPNRRQDGSSTLKIDAKNPIERAIEAFRSGRLIIADPLSPPPRGSRRRFGGDLAEEAAASLRIRTLYRRIERQLDQALQDGPLVQLKPLGLSLVALAGRLGAQRGLIECFTITPRSISRP